MFQILPTISSQKRKRTDFTLKEKKEIIDAVTKEQNQSKLAREMNKTWGIKVKRTRVKRILSKKGSIEAAIKAGIPSQRKKLKPGQHSKLDGRVLIWLKQAREHNLSVGGNLIKTEGL